MTREEAQQLLPVIQAFAEGKTIQVRINNNDTWTDLLDNKLEISKLFEYRIKPQPKYRPFKTKEECWQEMLKHQPFGWIRSILSDNLYLIESISDEIFCNRTFNSYNVAFEWFKFADSTPFGIKE